MKIDPYNILINVEKHWTMEFNPDALLIRSAEEECE